MNPDIIPRSVVVKVLISEENIQRRVTELALQISNNYSVLDGFFTSPRLLIIGILRGAFIFTADLTRQITIPHEVDFMALSSYGSTTTSGEVRTVMDLREPIENLHILLVEDIIDTGKTLSYLHRILQGRNPASIKTCVMTKKPHNSISIPIDYLGFEIPDVWVVGYGLDYNNCYRNFPYIAELRAEIYS